MIFDFGIFYKISVIS